MERDSPILEKQSGEVGWMIGREIWGAAPRTKNVLLIKKNKEKMARWICTLEFGCIRWLVFIQTDSFVEK